MTVITKWLDFLQHVESLWSTHALSPGHLLLDVVEDGNHISQAAMTVQLGNLTLNAINLPFDFNIAIRD